MTPAERQAQNQRIDQAVAPLIGLVNRAGKGCAALLTLLEFLPENDATRLGAKNVITDVQNKLTRLTVTAQDVKNTTDVEAVVESAGILVKSITKQLTQTILSGIFDKCITSLPDTLGELGNQLASIEARLQAARGVQSNAAAAPAGATPSLPASQPEPAPAPLETAKIPAEDGTPSKDGDKSVAAPAGG